MHDELLRIPRLTDEPKLILLNLMIKQLAINICLVILISVILAGSYENHDIVKYLSSRLKIS